jgi:hypothetical protein
MVYRVIFLLSLCLVTFGSRGAEIFKWVDENGRTHYGASVPDKYKKSAKSFDRQVTGPTEAQRQESEARLAKDKAAAESTATSKAKSNQPPAKSPSRPAIAGTDDKDTSCEAQKRRYEQSIDCFAPYINANGGIKAEAFQHCAEVKQPEC